MKRNILISLLVMAILGAGCVDTGNEPGNGTISDDAVIVHLTYGAFTLPEMAIQELVVNETAVNFSIYNYDHELTERYVKPLNESMREDLLELFRNNDFLELNDTYVPREGQPIVADTGVVEITLEQDDLNKTVKVDPYSSEYMPGNLQEIDQALVDLRTYAVTTSPQEAEEITTEWIINAPTYSYDGSDLTLQDHQVLESYPEQHLLNYSFVSSYAGYGNRSDEMVARVLTPHTITVTVSGGEVVSAIIDGVWDEMEQKMVTDVVTVEANLPCNDTPWQKWYEQGDVQFLKAPTEEELAVAYYGEVYGIEITGFDSTAMDVMTCRYTIEVISGDIDMMEEMGWTQV